MRRAGWLWRACQSPLSLYFAVLGILVALLVSIALDEHSRWRSR